MSETKDQLIQVFNQHIAEVEELAADLDATKVEIWRMRETRQIDGMVHHRQSHEIERLRTERADVVTLLREACRDFGDNDWADDLHLGDVIEKHLVKHLHNVKTVHCYSIDGRIIDCELAAALGENP